MNRQLGITVLIGSILAASASFAASTDFVDSPSQIQKHAGTSPILLAKGAAKPATKTRERRISTEREVRTGGNASTSINFDAIDIAGERKNPLGSLVSQSKSDMDYDFVKIRMRWHPEMVQSAASLESGSTTK
jgi:hypothetical protein